MMYVEVIPKSIAIVCQWPVTIELIVPEMLFFVPLRLRGQWIRSLEENSLLTFLLKRAEAQPLV